MFIGVYIIFLSAQKHSFWVLVRTASPIIYVLSRNTINIWFFLSENFPFLVVKFSVDLNRCVFVMWFCFRLSAIYVMSIHVVQLLFAALAGLYSVVVVFHRFIQSTIVISKSKGPSEVLRDIRITTYQICRIAEKITTDSYNNCSEFIDQVHRPILRWTKLQIKDGFLRR